MRSSPRSTKAAQLATALAVALALQGCAAPDARAPAAYPATGGETQRPTPNLPVPVVASVPATGPPGNFPDHGDDSPVHGSISARYVGRSGGSEHDRDAYAVVEASVNDPDQDAWNAYVSGQVSQDLDGGVNDGGSQFHSIEDTHGSSTHGRLYEAWVNANVSGFDALRFGRQEMGDTPEWIRFDGATIETAPAGGWKNQVGVYGGQPARMESPNAGDTLWGAWLKDRPWSGGRTRLDVMQLTDDERLGPDKNTLLSADVRQQFGTELGAEASYTWLDSAPRDLDVRGTWTRPDEGWTGQLSYHELLNEQNVLAEEIDPFSTALLSYQPYWQAGALLGKSFDTGYDLQAGGDVRRLNDASDAGDFNREWQRAFLTGVVHDLLVKGCSLSLTGERWQGSGSELGTWGVDVTQDWSHDVSASIGSYFSMYKDDILLGTEHQNVRTYYAKIKLRTDPRLTWTAGIDHELNEIDTYDTFTVRAVWSF